MVPTDDPKVTHLRNGDPAPEFQAQDQNNHLNRLKDFRGKMVLLYFYPEDDTSG